MGKEELIEFLSKKLNISTCVLEGMLHVGGEAQFKIFRRIAACIRLDDLLVEGKYPQQAYNIVAAEFNITERYVKMFKKKFPHHFFKFTCNEG